MSEHILIDLNELHAEENLVNSQHELDVAEDNEPFVDQCFLSEEEALVFYQNYARKNGFSVRKGRFVNKKGDRRRRDFVVIAKEQRSLTKTTQKRQETEAIQDVNARPICNFTILMKKSPETILTDQDPWMKQAVATEFPYTKHAFCIWHITTKFSSWFTSLLRQVDLAIEDVEQKQIHDTMLAKYQKCHLKSLLPLEKQGYQVLTPFAFKKFQDQFALVIQYSASNENDTSFIVKHYTANRLHKVVWDGKMAKCTCKNFEFIGILCRHVLCVLLHTGCFEIPSSYWLSRWSREEVGVNEVSQLHQEGTFDVSSSCANNSEPITNAIELAQCPVMSKTKGRPKQKRLKSGKELAKQVRRCRLCSSSKHNFSTCPEREPLVNANNAQQVDYNPKC
ncbi:hypothetical protein SSX86_025166 [Deinandra increscens subsp. villosa]|uniref:Protein FAR1-RELATED SEQUENCE n=1 Tax=Deinandra increscens subsp. villosa TaxID=3103831 RepID=A0AAP0GMY6_9ASTR